MPAYLSKAQAQLSAKKINKALMDLGPTALITMFEIDIANLVLDAGLNNNQDSVQDNQDNVLRFHNNVKLLDTSIKWQDKEYFACPIQAQGFELNGRGTLPTPKLAISVSPEGIPALAILKTRMRQLDDLIGAKVTRIRTYLENLDPINFSVDYEMPPYDSTIQQPELPRDVYYIDRKSAENKSSIEFELASILDVEGVKLPNRVVYANRCPFTYRCEGCLYENPSAMDDLNRANPPVPTSKVFGDATSADLFGDARPIANERDELIEDILNPDGTNSEAVKTFREQKAAINLTRYSKDTLKGIFKGNSVFIVKNNIRYYFVSKVNSPQDGPPNNNYWIADTCSKSVKGCKLRFKQIDRNGTEINRPLNFGGFAGADRIK